MLYPDFSIRLVAMGDSHIGVFDTISHRQPLWDLEICKVVGATAQGVVNPNSKTDSMAIFSDMIYKIQEPSKKFLLLNLGEVDCGFVIWYRAQKYNQSIQDQLNRSVTNYFRFIDSVVRNKFSPEQILIASVIPPTIEDNADPQYLAGARSEVYAGIVERTKLTAEYNEVLKSKCINEGFRYVDVFRRLISKKTGIIDPYFKHENPSNHHLSSRRSSDIWIEEIYNALN